MNKMPRNVPCPICHSEKTKFLFEGYDLLFGYPDSAFVYSCKECEHVFVAGELTPEQLTDMYTNYYPRAKFQVDTYQPHQKKHGFLHWLDGEEGSAHNHVPKNVRVLDIGCGYCETLGYHKNRGCEVYGVEADENAKKIADRYGFNVEIGLFDPKKYDPNFFDYVTMNFVLEHVVQPLDTLKDVARVLKPNGRFVAIVPSPHAWSRYVFGRNWIQWHLPYHRHFYSKRSVEILAEQAGFVVETVKSATPSSFLLGNWCTLFLYAAKGKKGRNADLFFQHFDDRDSKRFPVRFYQLLRTIRFLCLSMRIADMCGRGDCNLIVLRKKDSASLP